MKYIRKGILQLFDDKNKKRKERLNVLISRIQKLLRKVRLVNPVLISIDLSASLNTFYENESRGGYNDWVSIGEYCDKLELCQNNHFGLLTNGRVCVNFCIKGEDDFCKMANVVKEFKISGYDRENNYLFIISQDILVMFWYR